MQFHGYLHAVDAQPSERSGMPAETRSNLKLKCKDEVLPCVQPAGSAAALQLPF